MMEKKILNLEVEQFINNGSGLARLPNGQVVFIRGGLPGDKLDIAVESLEKRRGVLWASTYDFLEKSDIRTLPCCSHFKNCGGCATLHIETQHELSLKAQAVIDSLRRIGKWDKPTLNLIDFSKEASRYRGKLHADGVRLGWKSERSQNIVSPTSCHVLPLVLQKHLEHLKKMVNAASFKGEIYFAADPKSQEFILRFQGHSKKWQSLGDLQNQIQELKGMSYARKSGIPIRTWAKPHIDLDWNPFKASVFPEQFFQSNPMSWPVFWGILNQYLLHFQPQSIWDVHAGSGFLTSRLKGRSILASEPDSNAFIQLRKNLKRQAWDAFCFKGSAEDMLLQEPTRLQSLDGAILDPPRVGLSTPLRNWFIDHGPDSFLYFSCDIGTFSRDISHLTQAYTPIHPAFLLNVNPGTLRTEIAAIFKRKQNIN